METNNIKNVKTHTYEYMMKRVLLNYDKAKDYYKAILEDFKESNEVDFFSKELKSIYLSQGEDNFKKITGFNYTDFSFEKKNIKSEEHIFKLIQLSIIKTGKQEVAKKSGLTVPTINKIFESKNMTYKTFFSLINALNLEVNVKSSLL